MTSPQLSMSASRTFSEKEDITTVEGKAQEPSEYSGFWSQPLEKFVAWKTDIEQPRERRASAISRVPNGGTRAWLVVLATHCATFTTFGLINAWGVFQEYYEQNLLSDKSPSQIAWIGSIQYALVFMTGLPLGRIFDMGYLRIPVAFASIFLIAATLLVAECTEYYQFVLCQGFAIGLASGAVMGPCVSVVSQWFTTKQGIAFALSSSGSSLGGVVFPIAARKLIVLVGFSWTMRILALMQLVLLGITNTLIKRNLPRKPVLTPFSLRALKNPTFAFYCAAGFSVFLGLYTALTYIGVSATTAGLNEDFAFYLVAIANAASTAGRAVAGLTSDRIGPLSTIAPATLVAGIVTYVWPYARSKAAFIVVSIAYGASSGVFVGLFGAPPIDMGELSDYGTRLGLFLTISSFGALAGPPISGAINQSTDGFNFVGVYAGTAIVLSVVFFMISRHLKLGTLLGKA